MRHEPPDRRPAPLAGVLTPLALVAFLVALAAAPAVGAPAPGSARAAPSGGGTLDPQDGPHVDLTFAVEDRAVVVQMHMNLAFADAVVDVARESPDLVHAVEQGFLRDALLEWCRRVHVVEADGVALQPEPTGFRFHEADPVLIPLFPRFGPRAVARVSLLLDYPLERPARRVRLVWGAYPPDASFMGEGEPPPQEIKARLAAGGATRIVTFTADEPEHTWHADADTPEARFEAVPDGGAPGALALPALSAGMVAAWLAALLLGRGRPGRRRMLFLVGPFVLTGAWLVRGVLTVAVPDPFGWSTPVPDAADALAIFRPLHANIYHAFDYTDPGDVYDALARSVDGDLLDALYDQVYRGLIMQEHGGAVASVQGVRLLESEVDASGRFGDDRRPVFSVTARWQVDGVVLHWGHTHERTHEYHARYAVVLRDEGWRIAGSEVLGSRQVRAVDPPPGPPGEPTVPEEL